MSPNISQCASWAAELDLGGSDSSQGCIYPCEWRRSESNSFDGRRGKQFVSCIGRKLPVPALPVQLSKYYVDKVWFNVSHQEYAHRQRRTSTGKLTVQKFARYRQMRIYATIRVLSSFHLCLRLVVPLSARSEAYTE